MDEGHRKIRERALRAYYEDPVICKECKSVVKVRDNDRPGETRKRKFCSRSCAASFNNRKYPKRLKERQVVCPICGGTKSYGAKKCRTCRNKERWGETIEKPITNFFVKGATRAKYNTIREYARKAMKRWGVEKKCRICGFSAVVEVRHIKPISEFSDDTPLRVVNARENLDYVCPNHHAMVEKGPVKEKRP
jgi:hypothetical protein